MTKHYITPEEHGCSDLLRCDEEEKRIRRETLFFCLVFDKLCARIANVRFIDFAMKQFAAIHWAKKNVCSR